MFSESYSENKPIFLPPVYNNAQLEEIQSQSNISTLPQINQQINSNNIYLNEFETLQDYNKMSNVTNINNYTQDNTINQTNPVYTLEGEGINQLSNNIDNTNEVNSINYYNQYQYNNFDNNNIIDYSNQINSYNEYNIDNTPNSNPNYYESKNEYIPFQEVNNITPYTNNNVIYSENSGKQEILENPVISIEQNVLSNINNIAYENPVKEINQIIDVDSKEIINDIPPNNLNEIIQVDPSYEIPILNSKNQINNKEEQNVDSPKLINPLVSPIPPSPVALSTQSKQQNFEKITSRIHTLNIDEDHIFDNDKDKYNDFDVKSHFELSLSKEPNKFIYNKVRKAGILLLSHFEMPQDCEYHSPILSGNGKYIACIAHGPEDFVYVWDINDLNWYKYKFSSSRVDGITFTPDSENIIIIYRYSNPIMYSLSNGKKILEFEKNGEENNREGFQCSFTTTNTHFAYTTDKSFTLWSLRTGKVKQQIKDDSPIKIISNEYLICIDSNLNCEIKKISNQEIIHTFKIKGVESPDEILDAQIKEDLKYFAYIIKEGLIKYKFFEKEYTGIQKFECGVEKATISEDCKYVLKTNMKNLSIYDLEKNEDILTILKERFKEYRIYFKMKKLICIDDISINIQEYENEGSPQKYIWLNKNPIKFEDVQFSRDYKILLARVSKNEAIAYDLKTGEILRKWQNSEENCLDYKMTKFGGDRIATKSHLLLLKIWNFRKNKEEASFYGFNSHSLCFSGDGNYLACGANEGSEIARIWDIENKKYGIFKYAGNNNNFHTTVHLTSPRPKRLICCCTNQKPLIFNTYTTELLFECQCPYSFEEIYEIKSDLLYDVFIIKGRDDKKINVGLLYKLSDGTLLEVYENYSILELAKDFGFIVCKCSKINGGKLTSIDIRNLNEPIYRDFQIQTEKCRLLSDNKCAVIEYGDEFNKEYNMINIQNGNYFGKISFTKKGTRNSQTVLVVDPLENEIYFKYFEFLSPQETIILKKKNICNIVEESAD
jgi:hypothetical protein